MKSIISTQILYRKLFDMEEISEVPDDAFNLLKLISQQPQAFSPEQLRGAVGDNKIRNMALEYHIISESNSGKKLFAKAFVNWCKCIIFLESPSIIAARLLLHLQLASGSDTHLETSQEKGTETLVSKVVETLPPPQNKTCLISSDCETLGTLPFGKRPRSGRFF